MILSLAATAALTGVVGGHLNSSSPFDPFDSSWVLGGDDPANASSSSDQGVVVRTLTPDLLPGGGGGSVGVSGAGRGPPPLQEVNPWDVALCVTGTLVACENALVVAVLVYTPALRAPMFVLMGSLAAADLLAGLGLVLHFTLAYLAPPGGAPALLSAGVLIAGFSASVLSVLAITVDRYRSLYHALTYHTERTLTCTYAMVALTWTTCAALGALPALGWRCPADAAAAACSVCRPVAKGNAVALAAGLLLVFALMTQLHLQICRVALRHAQQIAVQRQFSSPSASSSTHSSTHVAVASVTTSTKGVSTLSAILCAFGACWLPLATYAMVADGSWPPAYAYVAALPAVCCSAINPVVYAFRNPDVQKSLWAACRGGGGGGRGGGGGGRGGGGGGGRGCGCGCVPPGLSLRPRTSSDV